MKILLGKYLFGCNRYLEDLILIYLQPEAVITYLARSKDMATNIHADAKKSDSFHGLIAKHPNLPSGQCSAL